MSEVKEPAGPGERVLERVLLGVIGVGGGALLIWIDQMGDGGLTLYMLIGLAAIGCGLWGMFTAVARRPSFLYSVAKWVEGSSAGSPTTPTGDPAVAWRPVDSGGFRQHQRAVVLGLGGLLFIEFLAVRATDYGPAAQYWWIGVGIGAALIVGGMVGGASTWTAGTKEPEKAISREQFRRSALVITLIGLVFAVFAIVMTIASYNSADAGGRYSIMALPFLLGQAGFVLGIVLLTWPIEAVPVGDGFVATAQPPGAPDSSVPPTPLVAEPPTGWWLAVDGRYYPPEQHPDYRPG
jgi:hypothetical protein